MMQIQGGFEPMTMRVKYEKKKILAEGGFELGTFRFKEQNTTTELRKPIMRMAIKKLSNSYTYDIVLANFSQFPPLFTYIVPI